NRDRVDGRVVPLEDDQGEDEPGDAADQEDPPATGGLLDNFAFLEHHAHGFTVPRVCLRAFRFADSPMRTGFLPRRRAASVDCAACRTWKAIRSRPSCTATRSERASPTRPRSIRSRPRSCATA